MGRVSYIVLAVAMWLASIAYVVVGARYAAERRAAISIKKIDVGVADEGRVRVATADSVRGWLAASGLGILGRGVDDVDVRAVEDFLGSKTGVKSVRARTDLSGNLTVRATQRVPLVKVATEKGVRFWVTRDGWILPFDERFSAPDTLSVRGEVPVMFDARRDAEYAAIQKQSFDEYLAEFARLRVETERLSAERAETRAALRRAQNSGPKRFWGRARKDAFERTKGERVKNLATELSKIDEALVRQKEKIAETRESEKISQENLAFLPKLANFVEFVVDSDFWSTKIARIDVRSLETAGVRSWELRIVPKGAAHEINFGGLDGSEFEKLAKLEAFYRTGEVLRYGFIDVQYKDQIVCRVN